MLTRLKRFLSMSRYNASFEKTKKKLTKRAESIQRTRRLVISAIMCAAGFVILFMGTLSGVLDLCALIITSAITAAAVIELGNPYPYLIWAVTSALSLLLLGNKLVAAEYLLFAGVYPMIKRAAERLGRAGEYAVKLAFFNAMLTLCVVISKYVLAMPVEDGLEFGVLIYLAGNLMFLLYDFALTSVITYYLVNLRSRIKADRI